MEREMVEFKGQEYPVKYRHERLLEECGDIAHRGGKTVAFIVTKYNDDRTPKTMIEGVAICGKKDVFGKKMGRMIAKGRLLKELKQLENACVM